jgi:V8-like Glu-specific endopeptidase
MWRLFPLCLLTIVLGAVMLASPARAITYGSPDGNGHPNVGALIGEFGGQKELVCSGTLISPTVFLTASHCTAFLESIGSDVWVTFDSEFDATSTLYPGTMHTNTAFNQRQSDSGDIAVITFASPLSGITPAGLPAAGVFDEMAKKGGLRGQTFTAVGYGVHEPVVGAGPPGFPFTSDRWVSTSSFRALNAAWLRLSQNNATGDGGTCFGDSGGPNFLATSSTIAAITITGDSMCLATNVVYRLDTPGARSFLDDFVTLP